MRYDDVENDEAIDLIRTLPDGSLYARATDPLRSWSEHRHLFADVIDAVWELTWALAADRHEMPEPAHVVRPRDIHIRRKVEASARAARAAVESDVWEEM